MGLDAVLSVSFISGMAKTVDDMLGSMNVVIAVLVISAGMLAFIVLYNLNNINISERKRELATLKVLGFFDREVSAYVNRENIMLTAIGMAVGLLLGLALHRFVMTTVETDTIMFGRVIRWYSYVFSGLLTIVFSMIVSGVQFFKIVRRHHVVGVHKGNGLAPGNVQPGVAGGGKAAVFLVDDLHPAVLRGVSVAQCAAAVGAAVVHKDQFKIGEGLAQQALGAGGQAVLYFIDRHDDADGRAFFFAHAPASFSLCRLPRAAARR